MPEEPQTDGWQVEGDSAEAYERYLVPRVLDGWARELIELAGVGRGARVLDVACGTGVVARRAADRVGPQGTVVGVDVNPGMLATAEHAAAGVDTPIRWEEAGAADMPVEDGAFDVVLSQQGLQFFPDPADALAEMRRTLVSGGRLAIAVLRSLDHHRAYAQFADALDQWVGAEAGGMMRSPFQGPDREGLRTLAEEAGFREMELMISRTSARYPSPSEFVRQEAASSPLSGPVASLDAKTQEALIDEVARALTWCTDDAGLSIPLETYVLTARR